MAQTGKWRKRHWRKQAVEALAATKAEPPMSWDRPWEPTPELRERQRADERRRQERLDLDLIDTAQDLVDLKRKAEEEEQKVAHMKRLLARKRELLTEIAMIQRERTEAEKETRAAERQLEFERRRAERLGQRTNGPRDGRPVRIDVDDGAWAVLQRDAVAQGTYLIGRIGELVRAEVQQLEAGDVTGTPASRRRRGPGEIDPDPRRRFLRIEVDDDTWRAFRLVTLDVGRTLARYLGEVAEAEAHRLGWRAF